MGGEHVARPILKDSKKYKHYKYYDNNTKITKEAE
jgi:hypothetical protein